MAISAVDLYERLKPKLGEGESKALIDYMDEKIRGEVATKEDLLILKGDLEKQIQGVRGELQGLREEIKDEIWKLRVLVIVVLIVTVILNPSVIKVIS